MLNQVPAPPVDMLMPPVNSVVAVINFCLLGVVIVLVIGDSRRSRSPLPLLILAGAALASLLEPIFDMVGAVWYPDHATTAYTRAFNVSVPLWLIPAYAWYIGGLGNVMLHQFRRGVSAGRLWRFYFLFWGANFILEMPGLNLNIYRYYGLQPFKVLGFPLWMAMTNGLMPLLIGALFHRLQPALKGAASVLTILLVPMVVGSAQIAAGWPVWLALNNGAGPTGTRWAALGSLTLACTVVYVLGVIGCIPGRAAPHR